MYSGLKLPLRWWQEGRREAGKQPQVNNQHQLSFLLKSRSGEGNGTHSSTLAMDGGAWWAAVHGVSKSQTRLSDFTFHFSLSCIGEGNGNPLQCSCLENSRDGSLVGCRLWGRTELETTEAT